jgi:hypothetical protein
MKARKKNSKNKKDAYKKIIIGVFEKHYKPGIRRFAFSRSELLAEAEKVGLDVESSADSTTRTANIGDVVYTYRFRKAFPPEILKTAAKEKMWIIAGAGDGQYEFRLITTPKLTADEGRFTTKVHDATPEIVRRFALNDEQAILARIRYNRLIDMFCRCVAYSLQNHLRTNIRGIGQIEIDELYVGSNRQGEHFIIPIQVKREKDALGVSQLLQDLEFCKVNHPHLTPKAIGAQMLKTKVEGEKYDLLALFEFECQDTLDDLVISKRAERHFLLLPYTKITESDFLQGKEREEEDI